MEIVSRWDNSNSSSSGNSNSTSNNGSGGSSSSVSAKAMDADIDRLAAVNDDSPGQAAANTATATRGSVPEASSQQLSSAATHADVSMLDTTNDLDFSTDGLAARMEVILADLVSRVGGQLSVPMDRRVPLVSLGLDSMSIIQFKGVLDNKYANLTHMQLLIWLGYLIIFTIYVLMYMSYGRYRCNIPDEFMFTTSATLENIILAVQNGKFMAILHI